MNTCKYKEDILILFETHHLLGLSDIHKLIPEADYSTIYRNVDILTEEGVLRKIVLDRKRTLYELSDQPIEHHHFVCRECNAVRDIPQNKVTIAFEDHLIESVIMHGLCQSCVSTG